MAWVRFNERGRCRWGGGWEKGRKDTGCAFLERYDSPYHLHPRTAVVPGNDFDPAMIEKKTVHHTRLIAWPFPLGSGDCGTLRFVGLVQHYSTRDYRSGTVPRLLSPDVVTPFCLACSSRDGGGGGDEDDDDSIGSATAASVAAAAAATTTTASGEPSPRRPMTHFRLRLPFISSRSNRRRCELKQVAMEHSVAVERTVGVESGFLGAAVIAAALLTT